jgi:hypothetical protein
VRHVENDFQRLMRRVLAEHYPGKGGQKRLAEDLKISPGRVSRAVTAGDYSFGLENCLRLAKVAKCSPLEVLEAAHKDEEAKLLKHFHFGTSDLRPGEPDLIELWRALLPEDHDEFVRRMTYVARLRGTTAQGGANTPVADPVPLPKRAKGRRGR